MFVVRFLIGGLVLVFNVVLFTVMVIGWCCEISIWMLYLVIVLFEFVLLLFVICFILFNLTFELLVFAVVCCVVSLWFVCFVCWC